MQVETSGSGILQEERDSGRLHKVIYLPFLLQSDKSRGDCCNLPLARNERSDLCDNLESVVGTEKYTLKDGIQWRGHFLFKLLYCTKTSSSARKTRRIGRPPPRKSKEPTIAHDSLQCLAQLSSMIGDNAVKTTLAAVLGLMISSVGIDANTGIARFTFGVPDLLACVIEHGAHAACDRSGTLASLVCRRHG